MSLGDEVREVLGFVFLGRIRDYDFLKFFLL